MNNDILKLIHNYDIYYNFNYKQYQSKTTGWNVDNKLFESLIKKTQPKIILELGSWYGASAISMGQIVQKLQLNTKIICVDTWLGSSEFIGLYETDPERQLLPLYGYPSAYYQFLANVCHNGLQDIIIPFPQVIQLACQWLKKQNITADLIYIDGSNDTMDVYNDILYSWPILNTNGIMFGDDYNNPRWLSINLGLNKFCASNNIQPQILSEFPNHWTLSKQSIDIHSNQSHLILITCTYNHVNRLSYFKYLINNIIQNISNYTWIIVEDGSEIDISLNKLLIESGVNYQYLYYGPTKSGGNAQRNFALEYIHDTGLRGIIYNMDDDNLYKLPLFDELRKVKKIAIFPVGGWGRPLSDPEKPILDNNYKFIGWNSAWQRKYATDMAGFAFSSSLLDSLSKPFWTFQNHGGGETEFIDRLIHNINDIEFNLCDNCSKCYVYHNQLREIQHPDTSSIDVYRTSDIKYKTKYGHSDTSTNTYNIIHNIWRDLYDETQIQLMLYTLEEVYANTDGCGGGPDRIEIASIIKNISKIHDKSTILELGCWKGRVSAILNLFKGNKDSCVISIDNFYSEDGIAFTDKKCENIKNIFHTTMKKFNIKSYKLIDQDMQNIDWLNLNIEPIAYIYYDNIVNSNIGIKTIESLMPILTKDCIIEFHDSSWPQNTEIIEKLCNVYSFKKLYKIDIWEGSLVIQRGLDVVI